MEKKSSVNLTKDNNCYYLTQNIGGLSLYEKAKLINRFVKNETKVLENFIDKEIKARLGRVGINIQDTSKGGLYALFDTLKSMGITIEITDLYENQEIYGCEYVGTSENHMNIYLEDKALLQCGVSLEIRGL